MESRLSYLETVERPDQTVDGGRQADGPRRRGFGGVRPRPEPRGQGTQAAGVAVQLLSGSGPL